MFCEELSYEKINYTIIIIIRLLKGLCKGFIIYIHKIQKHLFNHNSNTFFLFKLKFTFFKNILNTQNIKTII